eukprot:scaffold10020_cov161-Skeletonema_marinoi.AAC.15
MTAPSKATSFRFARFSFYYVSSFALCIAGRISRLFKIDRMNSSIVCCFTQKLVDPPWKTKPLLTTPMQRKDPLVLDFDLATSIVDRTSGR